MLKPYDTAEVINRDGVKAPVLAWLTDPMDLQFLQIQGSGRIQLEDGRQLRLGYADQNGHPYRPIGRWLVEQGQLKKEDVTMGSIHAWAQANPQRVPELLASNPSYVFFGTRPDSNEGPRGSLNVPLTAGYSVAIDRKVIPWAACCGCPLPVRMVARWCVRWAPRTPAAPSPARSAQTCSGELARRPANWQGT